MNYDGLIFVIGALGFIVLFCVVFYREMKKEMAKGSTKGQAFKKVFKTSLNNGEPYSGQSIHGAHNNSTTSRGPYPSSDYTHKTPDYIHDPTYAGYSQNIYNRNN